MIELINTWPAVAALLTCGTGAVICLEKWAVDAMSPENKGVAPSLNPVELAFLLRRGDTGHCVAVLVVDMVQKSLKSAEDEDDDHSVYKTQIIQSVHQYLRTKAEQKTSEIVDYKNLKTPAGVITGARQLRVFFVQKVRPFVSEIVRDPRNLKKYFNPAGILRIMLDVYSAGIKQSLEHELTKELENRGLLVSEPARFRCSGRLWKVAGFGILIACLSVVLVFYQAAPGCAFFILIAALVNGLVINGLLWSRSMVPFYEELGIVLNNVQRKGLRLAVLRSLFSGAETLFRIAVILILVLLICFEGILVNWISTLFFSLKPEVPQFLLVLATILFSLCIKLAFNAMAIERTPQPTVTGKIALEQYRKSLKHLSPISVLSDSLSSPDYDQRLSMLVSLYGIETLWFLL